MTPTEPTEEHGDDDGERVTEPDTHREDDTDAGDGDEGGESDGGDR